MSGVKLNYFEVSEVDYYRGMNRKFAHASMPVSYFYNYAGINNIKLNIREHDLCL